MQSVLSHMEVPTANSENVLVGCLIELTMELYSLGFLFAACNTSLLSILQNEVSANPQDARYELVGQFVDVNVRSFLLVLLCTLWNINVMLLALAVRMCSPHQDIGVHQSIQALAGPPCNLHSYIIIPNSCRHICFSYSEVDRKAVKLGYGGECR